MAHRDPNDLTVEERAFFKQYVDLGNLGLAYRKAFPKRKASVMSSHNLGSRMMTAIRGKDGFAKMLEEADLGEERILVEVNKRLNAMTTKEYLVDDVRFTASGQKRIKKLVVLGEETEDNSTRMRATELLARLHGKEIQKVEAEVKQVAAVVILPAEATEEEWMKLVGNGKG